MKTCAGILLYKDRQVFLAHPGGPFFAKRGNAWGIPKGEQNPGEGLIDTAVREFKEETSITVGSDPKESLLDLGFVKQSNKIVYCWGVEYKFDDIPKIKSNLSKFGWPEIDQARFFPLDIALQKILPAQKPFLERLASLV